MPASHPHTAKRIPSRIFDRPVRSLRMLPVLLCLGACASTPDKPPVEEDMSLPGDRARARMEDLPIGLFLRTINAEIRSWTKLTLTARSGEDERKASLLEQDLRRQTYDRLDDLIHELEAGPRPNRIVAASALGFTRNEKALSPLLAALEDADVEVQSNALLGLRLLEREETPLERICELMRYGRDSWVRSNAASCTSTLVNLGARSDCVVEAARDGLADSEPGVRSHSALILATLLDEESMDILPDLLYDEVRLVRSAAMRSIAYIGIEDPHQKAAAAHALVRAYIADDGPGRAQLLTTLEGLSGQHYGDDDEEWADWARRIQ
jgi:hypothetical protein